MFYNIFNTPFASINSTKKNQQVEHGSHFCKRFRSQGKTEKKIAYSQRQKNKHNQPEKSIISALGQYRQF